MADYDWSVGWPDGHASKSRSTPHAQKLTKPKTNRSTSSPRLFPSRIVTKLHNQPRGPQTSPLPKQSQPQPHPLEHPCRTTALAAIATQGSTAGHSTAQIGSTVDLSTLAHVSEGYTAGSIYRAVKTTLTPRRVHRIAKRPLLSAEFLGVLAQQQQLLKKHVQVRGSRVLSFVSCGNDGFHLVFGTPVRYQTRAEVEGAGGGWHSLGICCEEMCLSFFPTTTLSLSSLAAAVVPLDMASVGKLMAAALVCMPCVTNYPSTFCCCRTGVSRLYSKDYRA